MSTPTSGDVIIIDVEASGLGDCTYPLSVAIGCADGRFEHHFIRPPTQWIQDRVWDIRAQAIHNISFELLFRVGEPVDAVSRRINTVLKGASVYSDAPEYDQAWLNTLHAAAGNLPTYILRDLFGGLIPKEYLLDGRARRLKALAQAECPDAVSHTADGDVKVLWKMVELAREGKPSPVRGP